MAWEYYCPPIGIGDCAVQKSRSMLETSDDVIVEALRGEAGHIELRMIECPGNFGAASIKLMLPSQRACFRELQLLSYTTGVPFPKEVQDVAIPSASRPLPALHPASVAQETKLPAVVFIGSFVCCNLYIPRLPAAHRSGVGKRRRPAGTNHKWRND